PVHRTGSRHSLGSTPQLPTWSSFSPRLGARFSRPSLGSTWHWLSPGSSASSAACFSTRCPSRKRRGRERELRQSRRKTSSPRRTCTQPGGRSSRHGECILPTELRPAGVGGTGSRVGLFAEHHEQVEQVKNGRDLRCV